MQSDFRSANEKQLLIQQPTNGKYYENDVAAIKLKSPFTIKPMYVASDLLIAPATSDSKLLLKQK